MLKFDTSWHDFIKSVEVMTCPLCSEKMSDDGHDSNIVYTDKDGFLYEYYNGVLPYPHSTVWCRNNHGFYLDDYKLGRLTEW